MKFPSKGTTDFELPPPGNHVAICNMVADLGMQPGSGMYPDPKPQVYLRFELCDEVREFKNKEGVDIKAPMVIGRTFTASMHEKANLRKFVEAWSGTPFKDDDAAASYEFEKLPGKKCLLNVVHVTRGTKTYANIQSATPLPKSMKSDVGQYHKTIYYSLDDHSEIAFRALPEWIRKKIDSRINEREKPIQTDGGTTPIVGPDNDDDIPF